MKAAVLDFFGVWGSVIMAISAALTAISADIYLNARRPVPAKA